MRNIATYARAVTALALLVILATASAHAQSPLIIEPGVNAIPNAINGDANPPADRIYILRRGETYLYTEQIVTDRPIHIEAEAGDGPRPIIQANFDPTTEEGPRPFRPQFDFTIKGVYIYGRDTAGRFTDNATIRIAGENVRVVVDDCHFSANRASSVRADEAGAKIYITNSVFDHIEAPPGRGTAGYAIRINPVEVDSIVIRNTTMWNMNNMTIFNRGIINYLDVSRSTFYGIGVRTGFRDVVDGWQARKYVFADNIVYNVGYYGNNPGGFEAGTERYYVDADSVVVTDDDGNVLSIEAPAFKLENGNLYTSPVITDALPDSVSAYEPFGRGIQEQFAEGLGGEDTFFSEELAFATTPDVASYAALATYERNNGREGGPFLDLDPGADSPGTPPTNPLPVDFSYPVTARSYTAATGGCPLGDLNWFPSEYDRCNALTVSNERTDEVASNLSILDAYPNPASTGLAVRFVSPESATVEVALYDALGRQVLRSATKAVTAGATDAIGMDVSQLPSGLYIYRVESTSASGAIRMATGRVVVVR